MGEFPLIRRFFTRPQHATGPEVAMGIGDDCALLQLAPGMQWAVSTDMLVEGRHFFADINPHALGHKALAVNLSDLAACGARPVGFTLALALPAADEAWLGAFSRGLLALADAHACALVGGDTTRGPLNICITVFGEVPVGAALLRSGARPGDDIYVSGTLGDAHLGLQALQGHLQLPDAVLAHCRARLERPTPRIALGIALRGIASAAADVSDGLLGDLGHILERSNVGATVDTRLATELLGCRSVWAGRASAGAPMPESVLQSVLSGGDDYELVFTANPSERTAVQGAAHQAGVPVTRIGQIEAAPGLRVLGQDGAPLHSRFASFDHFAST
ncbi:MAG: thiamine-phosphate kinase [Rhodoferax sp.]|nr:thiamine-phosphate kinase [Rhodoferax sp.]